MASSTETETETRILICQGKANITLREVSITVDETRTKRAAQK